MTKAIETTAIVENERRLTLLDSVPIQDQTRVRVIILVPDDAEPDDQEWLRQAAANPAFDFLTDPAEDIYTVSDGKPFDDPR
ncbi:MAG: hypothetical protein R6X12_07050 [bacterium]